MSKADILPISIYVINSISGSIYIERFSERKSKKILTLIAWSIFYFLSQIVIANLTDNLYLTGNVVRIIFQTFVLIFMQTFFFRANTSKNLFASFSFIAGTEIIKYIVIVFYGLLADASAAGFLWLFDWGMMNTVTKVKVWHFAVELFDLCAGIFVYAVLLVGYLRIVGKTFVKKEYQLQTYENIFLLLPCIVTLSIAITLKIMLTNTETQTTVTAYEKIPTVKFWIPFICILLLGMIVSSVILFQKLVQLKEEEKKHAILENQINQIQREMGELQEIYADMRGLRHDMRNHLGNIMSYVRMALGKECDELTNYIENMENTINRLDFPYQTGNPITDIIIRQKSQQAAKNHITFEPDFTYPVNQQIDAYDIGIILNNALENALEACAKAEGKKEITLHSFLRGNLFFIEISNHFSGELTINEETHLPVSDKPDKQLHGIGISNILRCARKYMGDIDISISEADNSKKFCLTVMMNGSHSLPN